MYYFSATGRRFKFIPDSTIRAYKPRRFFPRHLRTIHLPVVSLVSPARTRMLPYQMAAPQSLYGYSVIPQVALQPGQRIVMVQPRPRTPISLADIEDDEPEYVPVKPPTKRVNQFLEELMDDPELEEFSSKTRQIRKDAESALQRLSSSSKSTGAASDYFRNYNYERIYGTPRSAIERVSPITVPHTSAEDEFESKIKKSSYRSYEPASYRSGSVVTGTSLLANRLRNLYRELDEPLDVYVPPSRTYEPVESRLDTIPSTVAGIRSDVTKRSWVMEPLQPACGASTAAVTKPLKRERVYYRDPDSVKNNISIRAQYASTREAASKNIRKNNDYLMP